MTIIQEDKLTIDPDKIEDLLSVPFSELRKGVYAAQRQEGYQTRVNDEKNEKIRKSENYEIFNNFVKTCHLKNLNKNDFKKPSQKIFNKIARS